MKDMIIYPGEDTQVEYWTRKLGITRAQLHEAILETGSLRVPEIKSYLKTKKHPFSFSGIITYIKLLAS